MAPHQFPGPVRGCSPNPRDAVCVSLCFRGGCWLGRRVGEASVGKIDIQSEGRGGKGEGEQVRGQVLFMPVHSDKELKEVVLSLNPACQYIRNIIIFYLAVCSIGII